MEIMLRAAARGQAQQGRYEETAEGANVSADLLRRFRIADCRYVVTVLMMLSARTCFGIFGANLAFRYGLAWGSSRRTCFYVADLPGDTQGELAFTLLACGAL